MNARYLAHHVVYNGTDHGLAVVEITMLADGSHKIKVEPFAREIHSTSFHSGTIRVVDRPGREPELIFE